MLWDIKRCLKCSVSSPLISCPDSARQMQGNYTAEAFPAGNQLPLKTHSKILLEDNVILPSTPYQYCVCDRFNVVYKKCDVGEGF